MKKNAFNLLVFTTFLAISLNSCTNQDCVKGSGNQVTQNRAIGLFTNIDSEGSLKIVLKQDSTSAVKILADDNIQEKIQTKLNGSTLKIFIEGNLCEIGPVVVYLNSKDYQKIQSSGDVELISEGNLNLNDLELDLQGSSSVTLDLNIKSLKTFSSGTSKIELKGQAGIHDLEMTGSSSVEALNFVVGEYRISSTGESKSRINVLNVLDINSRGSAQIDYKGKPTKITKNNVGTSVIRTIN